MIRPSRARIHAWLPLAASVGLSCGLLLPYPGGGDPAAAFTLEDSGVEDEQEPLFDPPTDASINVINNLEDIVVAVPGGAFPISLNFQAPNQNVVGGGIRFAGSDEVQWTLLNSVMGQATGDVAFSYVVSPSACDDVANLCHEVSADQFVITDVGGEFNVSEPIAVTVVLQCATCTSTSCIEILPPGSCQECSQPDSCQDLYDACYGPGAPFEGTSEEKVFKQFLGLQGSLWKGAETCVEGEALCDAFLQEDRCEF
jgi:hypothetical protein